MSGMELNFWEVNMAYRILEMQSFGPSTVGKTTVDAAVRSFKQAKAARPSANPESSGVITGFCNFLRQHGILKPISEGSKNIVSDAGDILQKLKK